MQRTAELWVVHAIRAAVPNDAVTYWDMTTEGIGHGKYGKLATAKRDMGLADHIS